MGEYTLITPVSQRQKELPIMRHQFYGEKLRVKNHKEICSEKLFTFYQKMLIHEKGSYSLV